MHSSPTSLVAALDIGGTKIAAGLVTRDGHILAQSSAPTAPELGFEAAMQRAAALIEGLTAQTGAHPQAIGIGCTGPVDPFTGEMGDVNTLPGWRGNLITSLLDRLGIPAALENDADAATLAEAAFGAGRGLATFLLVSVGTGIGAGMTIHGQLYRGVGGAHPEIGHMIIVPDGLACTCGARGCWEAYAAGPTWEAWYNQMYRPDLPAWDARQICAAADEGNGLALEAVEHEGAMLGLGLANLVSIFCPDAIALAGGLMTRFDLFEPAIRQVIRENCRLVPADKVRITRAELGDRTGLLGAAQAWWFSNPEK